MPAPEFTSVCQFDANYFLYLKTMTKNETCCDTNFRNHFFLWASKLALFTSSTYLKYYQSLGVRIGLVILYVNILLLGGRILVSSLFTLDF